MYFTDPPYGLPKRAEDPRRELDFFGVYRWSAETGEVTLLTKALTRPNGLAFSPDEQTLYVANYDPEHAVWMACPVKPTARSAKGVLSRRNEHGRDAQGAPGSPQGGSPGQPVCDGTLLARIDTGQATANWRPTTDPYSTSRRTRISAASRRN